MRFTRKGLIFIVMRLIITFCLFSTFIKVNAQVNLVPNPSFEDTVHCPTGISQLNNTALWNNPNGGTVDYFNSCADYSSTFVSVPQNAAGYQLAFLGNAYVGMYLYQRNTSGGPFDCREYIQSLLSDTLKNGITYCISFYVNYATLSNIAIDNIGAYLSTTPVNVSSATVLPYSPQIVSPSGLFIQDTLDWYKVEGTYTAAGGEKYITIGNFKDAANTDTIHTDPYSASSAYYYIDNVSVIDCNDTANSIHEIQKDISFNVYPNPSSRLINLEYKFRPDDNAVIEIYDITGKLVMKEKLNSSQFTSKLDCSEFQNGIYFYHLLLNNAVTKNDKLIIIK